MKSSEHNTQGWGISTRTTLALFILLLAVYGLSYSGRFSTDDEHILASRSLSLAFQGELNDDRVLGNSRIFTYQDLPTEQAAASLAIEPFQSVIGAGLARLAFLLGTGRVQTLFLLNIFAVAVTAVSVFTAVRILGYSDRTALVTALFFGLGTLVWVYTRTLFRDPLAMLFLTIAWTCALILNHAGIKRDQYLAGAGVLLGLALGILSKNTVTLAIPSVLTLLIPFWRRIGEKGKLAKKPWITRLMVIIPVLIALVGFLSLLMTARGPLSRFSLRYYGEILNFFFNNPHPNLLPAIIGPFVSPGKSVFVYSPVLLLSIVPLLEKRIEAVAAWSYVLLLVVAQALFYDGNWWGSVNWGLRFLVPAVPLLIIALGSVFDRLLRIPTGWIWIAFLGCVSALIQLIGISAPLGEYYQYLTGLSREAAGTLGVWELRYSALTWTANRILEGKQWDIAALGAGTQGLLFAGLLSLAAYLSFLRYRTRPVWAAALLVISVMISLLLMPGVYRADPVYSSDRSDFRAVQDDLLALVESTDGLVISSYATPAWRYWMNWGSTSPAWVSLPFVYPAASDLPAQVEIILTDTARTHERVWLLLPCDSPPSAALLAQKDQLRSLELLDEWIYVDGDCSTSLLLLGSP